MMMNRRISRIALPLIGLALAGASAPPDDPAIPPLTTNASALALWATQSAADSAAKGGIGAAFMPTPAGLAVLAVAPNSPADRAGLGDDGFTIVESVNDMPLKGLSGTEMMKLLRAGGSPLRLGIAGQSAVTITLPEHGG
jgi:C-terminal processing protease CtpA/Prc